MKSDQGNEVKKVESKKRTWLAQRRLAAGYKSSRSFALAVGLSPSYYYEIESGTKNPGGNTAFLIANHLQFDMSLFYGQSVHC
jgi:transcriptional regulator with XRE-family HTH domain